MRLAYHDRTEMSTKRLFGKRRQCLALDALVPVSHASRNIRTWKSLDDCIKGLSGFVSNIVPASDPTMDPGRYKTIKTGRGLVYNYYASHAQPGKHTLLFLHGYPSTSSDWATFVAFFEALGHVAIVPDLLGFGGTDKPTDAQLYVSTGLVDDVRDILDAERVDKVVVVGHDWYKLPFSPLQTH